MTSSSTKEIRSVCVFCASSNGVDPIFLEAAKTLGTSIAERGWCLVYGGADVGLMGALANAALAAGGKVAGVIPGALVSREIAHPGLTELIETPSMHDRKAQMAERADAFLVLPGGMGTLDEMCEILTWALLGIHDKPVIMINTAGYWNRFLHLLDGAAEAGFLRPDHRTLCRTAPDPIAACELLADLCSSR
jgi:uncharacterized protein (TIGR00730 family)